MIFLKAPSVTQWEKHFGYESMELAEMGSYKSQLELELEFILCYLICGMGAISAFFNIRLME